jgi:cytochrome c peroxidase
VFVAFIALAIAWVPDWASGGTKRTGKLSGSTQLGLRLFRDERFATTKGDLPASCSHCHLFDEDPQGVRAHTDFLSRSWVSYRLGDPRRDELRNSPTLFDVAKMPRLHFDGEFSSLEALVKGTLSGRPMGWLPGEEQEALEQIYRVVISDSGEGERRGTTYKELFKSRYGVNVESLARDEVVEWVAKAISDYMRTLNSERQTPYDRFITLNGLPAEPNKGEDSVAYVRRLLGGVLKLESEGKLRLMKAFDQTALVGMKTFFRVEGPGSVGNCVSCHAPPLFTDFSFHNMGISQLEYDRLHGEGSFAGLKLPTGAEVARPAARLRETPSRSKPGEVDLGHWNFVDVKSSSLRRPGETEDQFLNRMIGTFKTPTLRHLAYTPPYMHNGAFNTLEESLSGLITLSEMARAGRIRQADDQLARIRISEQDIRPLIAFLNALNEDFPARPSQ